MLEARPAKRHAAHRFSRDARYEILETDAAIGGLVYEIKGESATLTVRGDSFICARGRKRQDERVYQAAWRKLSGGAKPAANPVLMKDASGAVLAQAERSGSGWLIAADAERFELRRRSAFSRLYDLYREGRGEALGSVGQRKILTTKLHVDLPSELAAPLQVFLLALLLDLTFVSLDNLGDTSA